MMIGPRLKYLLKYKDKLIGAISFNQAALKLKCRDILVGATEEDFRKFVLPHIINNNRFLILPWVNIRYLASKVLSAIVSTVKADWYEKYNVEPYALETFVDITRYKGISYRAANWQYLGETRGFEKIGKEFIYHGNKKGIFFRIINRKSFRYLVKQYCRPPVQKEIKEKILKPLQERIGETTVMLSSLPIWDPNLFGDICLNKKTVSGLGPQLLAYLDEYNPCFTEDEHAEYFVTYIKGLLSDTQDRKNIENIANALMIPNRVRSLQHFLKNYEWDNQNAIEIYQHEIYEFANDQNGMLTVDDTGFLKWGKNSFGVAHQYLGCVGKTANGQSGVFIGYVGQNGHGLLEGELYVPNSWFTESEKLSLWEKCDAPKELKFRTKSEIAIELIQKIKKRNNFTYKWVGCDASYGCSKEFRDSLPEDVYFFADLKSNQTVFVNNTKCRVDAISKNENIPWQSVERYIGAKGPAALSFKCLRVNENDNNKPGTELWLYIRKNANNDIRYAFSNAPDNIEIVELHSASFLRWSIEQCFKECKGYLGMGHYETRSYRGWHRHMLLVMIAHLFLNLVRHKFKKPFKLIPTDTDKGDMSGLNNGIKHIGEADQSNEESINVCEALSILETALLDSETLLARYIYLPVLTIPNAFKLVSSAILGIEAFIKNAINVVNNDMRNYHKSIRSYCRHYKSVFITSN
jgi:SRSO17 transposase